MYSIETESYKIKDLGIGYGVFKKLDSTLELKDNHLINLGESYIVVNLLNQSDDGNIWDGMSN
jgi:hypothetical protein